MGKLVELLEKNKNLIVMGSKEDLAEELKELSDHLRKLSWITTTMILVVFVFELILAFFYRENPLILTGIAGAMGITVIGAIDRMSKISKEYGQTALLINLAARLTPEQTAKVVAALLAK